MLEVLSTNRDLQTCIREEEDMMNLAIEDLPSYELAVRKVMERGREEGREEGARKTARLMFLRLFEARFGRPDESVQARVDAASAQTLMTWSEKLLQASTPADVFK